MTEKKMRRSEIGMSKQKGDERERDLVKEVIKVRRKWCGVKG